MNYFLNFLDAPSRTFRSMNKNFKAVIIQTKATGVKPITEQYLSAGLLTVLYRVVQTFEPVQEILKCGDSYDVIHFIIPNLK